MGRASGNPLRGTVIEYRHDLFHCPHAGDCDLTDVSVPGFGEPPYNATSNTYLLDAAFRPGCDGGIVVGGHHSFNSSTGYIIRFQIEGARRCP